MHRPVLGCATDLGPSGDHALAWAVELARGSRARVAVIHAVDDPGADEPAFLAEPLHPVFAAYRARLEQRKSEALEKLAAVRRDLEAAGIECSVELSSGRPWTAVLTAAKRANVDLLVVGPHGLTPPGGARLRLPRLLGSTSDPLLRHADRPVWVCPPTFPVPAEPWSALVAVDLGPSTSDVLELASGLRRAFSIRPSLLHVLSGAEEAGASEALRVLGTHARERLEALAKQHGLADAPLLVEVAEWPAEAIEARAEALGATVVIAGTGGAPSWARAFVGSTAEHLVRHPGRAVCVVRRPDDGFALTRGGGAG